MSNSIFYHAGCPVCVSAEKDIISLIGKEKVQVIHLGENQEELSKAIDFGVESVPALVTPKGNVLHLNYGASIEDLKA